jgi:hypothetical protein
MATIDDLLAEIDEVRLSLPLPLTLQVSNDTAGPSLEDILGENMPPSQLAAVSSPSALEPRVDVLSPTSNARGGSESPPPLAEHANSSATDSLAISERRAPQPSISTSSPSPPPPLDATDHPQGASPPPPAAELEEESKSRPSSKRLSGLGLSSG